MELKYSWLVAFVIHQCCIRQGFTQAPTDLTPSLVVLAPYNQTTDLFIGQKTRLELTIAFPVGTISGVVVEILPSTNVTVMGFANAVISSIGPNIAGSVSNISAVYYASPETVSSPFRIYTRGVFNFSEVTNTNGIGTGSEPNELKIHFDAYVASIDAIQDNDTHWISAGVEFNNSYNVWIGQISYIIRTVTPTQVKEASFQLQTVTDPNLEVGTSLRILVDVLMPYSNPNMSFEAISMHENTSNTDLRVVGVNLIKVGKNFEQLADLTQFTSNDIVCSVDFAGARRVALQFPSNFVNMDSLEPGNATQADLLQFEAVVYLKETATIGEIHPIGLGVDVDNNEVWVCYFNITAVSATPVANDFQVSLITANDSLILGKASSLEANITVPTNNIMTFNVTVQTKLKASLNPSGLIVADIQVKNRGENIQCYTLESLSFSSSSGSLINSVAVAQFRVTNYGLYTHVYGAQANNFTLEITVFPLTSGSSVNDVYEVEVTVDTSPTEVLEMTVVGVAPFDVPVNYSFSFYHNCRTNCLSRGALFEFVLDITTQRNSNPGQVTVEFPVPTNYSESFFSVCNYSIASIGRNVRSLSEDMIKSASNMTSSADGAYELVTVVMPEVSNMGTYDDIEDDKIKITILAQFRNSTGVSSDSEEWFGIGSKYSSTQVWVAQYKICVKAPSYFPKLAIIEGIALDSEDLVNNTFLGVRGIEYSLNGIQYSDKAATWNPDAGNSTHTVYKLQQPFMTSYVSMAQINYTCTRSCYIDHEFLVSPMDDYLEIFNDKNNTLLQNIPTAIDNSNDTCFGLPVNGTTPPLFWARMNTTLLNINFKQFELLVTGKGISCTRSGTTRVLQVSYPTSSSINKFHGDIKFCDLIANAEGTLPTDLSTCKYQCACQDVAQCQEIILFMSNSESTFSWELCEISATNY